MDAAVSLTLAQVIALVAALAAGGWSWASGMGRDDRLLLHPFAAGNLLVLAGVLLTLGRSPDATALERTLHYWLADVCALSGMASFAYGVFGVLGLNRWPRRLGAAVVGAALLMALLPGPELRWRGFLFGVTAAGLCGSLAWRARAAHRRRQEQLVVGPIILVFGAIALSMAVRALLLAWGPEWALKAEATAVGTSLPMLWTVLVQLMVMNLALVGLVLSRLVQRIHHLARHDPLTGCLNRRAVDHHLTAELQAGGYGVILLDLDHFKQVNDRYGHNAGDAALRHVVAVLQAGLREEDLLARWGGEEFLLILPGATVTETLQAAERLRAALEAEPLLWQGAPLHLTASFSVGSFRREAMDVTALDAGLYRAKAAGRNQVVRA
ncbi:GGDEF domain-containing protein [Inhella gelatinilytica]|uniref:diguanylate cyclase n=1 Tax=Inhella gelatinilytica TaxID=2795030 RepID=A0A931IUV9_9BURK|nr:GGDEF domain-containing protein [Inhella gelatinilytica]MBH9551981.1 GGDEF domain-containing protein [Inhella gelatinilytica]